MTKVQYFTACTLDGFIADEHNSLDWLFEVPHDGDGDEGDWDEFISGVGALVMGATTYEWMVDRYDMVANPQQWREFYGDRPGWVFTHRDLPRLPGIDIHLVSGEVRPVYDEIVAAVPDRNIWVLGGGDLVGQLDDAGLLDEIWLGLTPVTLGAGAPLLPRRITSSRMRVRQARQAGQRVRVVLDVERGQGPGGPG
ncbi:dihydrofolate reductase family protein [Nocardioides koreensis]|uniref:Dihydrofolate reductase family protein n=1 Tax=Nocardioides koreensis TaxID=433651 RepID=A0ABP5KQK9_9ACTN